MEEQVIEQENNLLLRGKKVRHRKKQLYQTILQQMEFYFSDSNLTKDRFLSNLIQQDPWVDLSVFLTFNKIRNLTTNVRDIAKSVKSSTLLELSEDGTKVSRPSPIKPREDIDQCTIYVERITPDMNHESLTKIFSRFGQVQYVSIPKYKHNHMMKGFAFIEFDSPEAAQKALDHFAEIGCKLPLMMPPEKLYSIITFENESETGKRKCEDDSDERDPKRIKLEPPKKRRRRNKKSKDGLDLRQFGFQVLSKVEWKRLRNKYLNLQHKKMSALKQQLYRARFCNKDDKEENSKFQITPGTVVKVVFDEMCDLSHVKSEVKRISNDVKYVDITEGSYEGFLRFATPESAKNFLESDFKAKMNVLENAEFELYVEKATNERQSRFNDAKKKRTRGRNKLMKKAERELGIHIQFDEDN